MYTEGDPLGFAKYRDFVSNNLKSTSWEVEIGNYKLISVAGSAITGIQTRIFDADIYSLNLQAQTGFNRIGLWQLLTVTNETKGGTDMLFRWGNDVPSVIASDWSLLKSFTPVMGSVQTTDNVPTLIHTFSPAEGKFYEIDFTVTSALSAGVGGFRGIYGMLVHRDTIAFVDQGLATLLAKATPTHTPLTVTAEASGTDILIKVKGLTALTWDWKIELDIMEIDQ